EVEYDGIVVEEEDDDNKESIETWKFGIEEEQKLAFDDISAQHMVEDLKPRR
ncbi:hypothetical protein U1Q18_013954, partial [Sarracenia purpurea var. burkii]